MQLDNSVDELSVVNSFTGLNVSMISNDNTKIQKSKLLQNDQSQQIKEQKTSNAIKMQLYQEEIFQKSPNQSMNQSQMLSHIIELDNSRLEMSIEKSIDVNENSVQYNGSPLNRTINQSLNEMNLSGSLLNDSNNAFRLVTGHVQLHQNMEQVLQKIDKVQSQSIDPNLSEQINKQPFFNDFSAIQTKKIMDNSISKVIIQKDLIDQIKKKQLSNLNSRIFQQADSTFTLSNRTNNQFLNNNSQLINVNGINQSAQQITYNDGPLFTNGNIFSRNIYKEKLQAFKKRKLIKQKQQSIVLKVQKAQKTSTQKKKIQKNQMPKQKIKYLPQIKSQNLQVLNKMFNDNQNVIRKNFRGLSSRYYNIFFIDQTLPFCNRYILDLSINVDIKDVQFLKRRKNDENKYQDKKIQQEKGYKIDQVSKSVKQTLSDIKQQKKQSLQPKIIDEQRRKYVQERNRKKSQKREQLKKLKQEKLKKKEGHRFQQVGLFQIKMNLLTSVVWQHVVCLGMKRSLIDDQTFKLFVNCADKFPNLMRIQFSENQIKDQGFIYFVENSYKFSNLFDILLEKNKITNKGLKALSNEQLDFVFYKRIRLSENFIDDEGYECFFSKGKNHPNLLQIKFDGNPNNYKRLMTCKSLETFANNILFFKQLKEVHFLNNSIKDYGLKKFADNIHELNKLTQINFGINYITSEGFKYFLNKINKFSLNSIRKLHFNKNIIEKIPQNEINSLVKDQYSTLIFMNIKQNPLEQDRQSCFFLVDIFFNMKLEFKLEVFLNTPFTLDLQNIKCDFKRAIQIINGNDPGVIKGTNNDSTRNQTFIQEINENKATKKNQNDTRFQRLSQLNVSNKNLTSQDWSFIVKNINNLPQLQNLFLDKNNIKNVKIQQLNYLQESVLKRPRKQSRILKITLTNNILNEQSIKNIVQFTQDTENRVIFFILFPQISQKNYSQIQKNVLIDEQKKYQQKYFKIKIQASLSFGLRELTISKDIKDLKFQKRFEKMLRQIVGYCKNHISCFQKVKFMFSVFEKSIKTEREYKTKKVQIDRVWEIIKKFCFDMIDKWSKNSKNGAQQFQFSQQQVKSLLKELSHIKLTKSENKKKSEKLTSIKQEQENSHIQ